MCVVSGAETDIEPDRTFQLLLVHSPSVSMILQGLFKLNYTVPIQGVSIEVPMKFIAIRYFSQGAELQNIVICKRHLELL